MNTARTLQSAVRSGDRQRTRDCVEALRKAGWTTRECYRLALAGNPDLTEEDFTRLLPAFLPPVRP